MTTTVNVTTSVCRCWLFHWTERQLEKWDDVTKLQRSNPIRIHRTWRNKRFLVCSIRWEDLIQIRYATTQNGLVGIWLTIKFKLLRRKMWGDIISATAGTCKIFAWQFAKVIFWGVCHGGFLQLSCARTQWPVTVTALVLQNTCATSSSLICVRLALQGGRRFPPTLNLWSINWFLGLTRNSRWIFNDHFKLYRVA